MILPKILYGSKKFIIKRLPAKAKIIVMVKNGYLSQSIGFENLKTFFLFLNRFEK
jgi:hypothetical protein